MARPVLDPGLQRERTSLSWNRTALALVANGALVLVRHENAFPLPVATALAALSVLAAVLAVGQATRRSRIVRQPGDQIAAPTRSVVTLGVVVTLLSLCVVLAVLLAGS